MLLKIIPAILRYLDTRPSFSEIISRNCLFKYVDLFICTRSDTRSDGLMDQSDYQLGVGGRTTRIGSLAAPLDYMHIYIRQATPQARMWKGNPVSLLGICSYMHETYAYQQPHVRRFISFNLDKTARS